MNRGTEKCPADGVGDILLALEWVDNPLVDERSRRKILTVLRHTGEEDFALIRRVTKLSASNLSIHLSKLEKAGYVEIGKRFEGKKPVTSARMTARGCAAVEEYWQGVRLLDGLEGNG